MRFNWQSGESGVRKVSSCFILVQILCNLAGFSLNYLLKEKAKIILNELKIGIEAENYENSLSA